MAVDSHIHLSHRMFGGPDNKSCSVPCIASLSGDELIKDYTRDGLIEALKADGIEFCIEPGISAESNELILSHAETYKGYIYPAVGVHPTRTSAAPFKFYMELEKLASNPSVVAIGELGLDYHHPRRQQHRLRQKWWFVKQILLADRCNLPLVLHLRSAESDSVRILRRYKKKIHGGVCHCFNGNAELAKVYTDELGLMLGIGGSLLQDECEGLEEAVRNTPIEFLLLETDGPYVKPKQPGGVSSKQWSKARNTSFIIKDVALRIAEIKHMDAKEVERITAENARRLFGI